jgi:hypothetical protein
MEEKSQGFATVKTSASWSNWSLDTMQDKGYAAEASIDQKSLQGLNSGRSDDEVGEIAAQSDCIPHTTLGKGYGAEEKSTNREGSSILYEISISNETSGWYPDDEGEVWAEWRAYWSTKVQWLRRLCFGCIGKR